MNPRRIALFLSPLALAPMVLLGGARADDRGMFGGGPERNMVSDETNLPASWDPETGENIMWTQPLGSQTYGGPVVAGDRIYVGTNNEGLRNPKLTGDRGNVMAFDAEQRRVPLAVGARQAAGRPGQRLAAAGRLLDALRRRATGSTTSRTAPR